jgi:uncharacterized protein (TIGR02099 family)
MAAAIIFAATAVSVGRLLTPVLNTHRADFAKLAGEFLQSPVTINKVHISWYRFEPILTLERVAVLDKKTLSPTFEIHKLKVNFKIFASLLQRSMLLENVIIDGMQVTLRQKTSGQFHVNGLEGIAVKDNATGSAMTADTLAGWIIARPYLGLRNIQIQFVSISGSERSITIRRLALHNTTTGHVLEGQVILDQATPTQVTINLQWAGDTLDILHHSAQGQLSLDIESLSLSQWLTQQTWRGIQIKQGEGNAEILVAWEHNQLQKVQSQFQLYEMQLQSLITNKVLTISRANGEVNWQRDGDRQILTGENILLDFPQHLWPKTHFSLTLLPMEETAQIPMRRKLGGYILQVGYLDLADTRDLAFSSGLLPESLQKQLLALQPAGEVHSLNISASDMTQLEKNSYSAEFFNLSANSWQNIPGFKNISGSISWDGKEGKVILDSHQAIVTLDSLFSKPLQFDVIAGSMQWQKSMNDTWLLDVKPFHISNPDISLAVAMNIIIPQHTSPTLNLRGEFAVPHIQHIEDYLPVKLFEPPFVKWLHNRFQKGEISSGSIVVQGKLNEFPFVNGWGKFLIDTKVRDLNFEYAPNWPTILHANGQLVFSGQSMTAEVDSGKIFDATINHAHGHIPYIGPLHPQVLTVQADITTDLQQGLRFVHESPLDNTLGKDLTGMQLAGPAQLTLACTIPVKTPELSKVKGKIETSAGYLQLPEWGLTVDHMSGTLHFTEASLQTTQILGLLFNEPISININTTSASSSPPVVSAIIQGKIALPALQTWLHMPLSSYLKGSAKYTAEFRLISQQYSQPSQLIIHSNLVGVAVNLPSVYVKKASEPRDFQLNLNLKSNQPLHALLTYGKLATAALTYEKSAGNWQFKAADLQLSQVPLWGQTLTQAHVQLTPQENDWQLNIKSQEMAGQVWLPRTTTHPIIRANLQHLYFKAVDDKRVIDPKAIPAISLIGDDIHYNDKSFGHVELELSPLAAGLQIQRLRIASLLFNLDAKGKWLANKNNSQTSLEGKLITKNISKLLSQWDMDSENLIVNDGSADFNLTWADAPYKPQLSLMSGSLGLKLGKGRVVNLTSSTNAKVGFGRMLNILNLQTLPRRFSLDFTDLFEKGYSFDTMQGHFTLQQGNATTQDTYFDGPIAHIGIKGRVGFAAKDYDLNLSVTPYVTGSIPVVATLAGGPVVGAVSWLVEKVASNAVSKVTTYHYSVSGSWDNPNWAQLK